MIPPRGVDTEHTVDRTPHHTWWSLAPERSPRTRQLRHLANGSAPRLHWSVVKAWGIAAVVVTIVGCEPAVDVVPACGEPIAELTAAKRAARHVQAFRGRTRLRVTQACADIAFDLTGEQPALDRALSQTSASVICAVSKTAIEARLDDGADLAAEIEDFGACYSYVAAEAECNAECGASSICDDACAASGVFQGGCRNPDIRVQSSDATLEATMEENFSAILALDLFLANDAGDGRDRLDDAIHGLRANFSDAPGCARERAALQTLDAEANVAFSELFDLLRWLRISRLSVIE